MSVEMNHTIVHATDTVATARHFAEILGVPSPVRYGPFEVVRLSNGVSLDVLETQPPITPQHYAFLVGDNEFDEILDRITGRELAHWADPFHQQTGQINHNDGGRGVYWQAPDGHNLEIITVPYGGAP